MHYILHMRLSAGVLLSTSDTHVPVSSWVALLKTSPAAVPPVVPPPLPVLPLPQPVLPLPQPVLPAPQQVHVQAPLLHPQALAADMLEPTYIPENTLDEFLMGAAQDFQLEGLPGSPVVQLPSPPPLAAAAAAAVVAQVPPSLQELHDAVLRMRGIIQRQDQHIQHLTTQLQRALQRLRQTEPQHQPQQSLYQLLYGDNIPDDLLSIMEMDDL